MENRSPYKTAAELGIEQWEYTGLLALIGPLSHKNLALDMREWEKERDCGTVRCIGGWLAHYRGIDPEIYVMDADTRGHPMHYLFWPSIGIAWRAKNTHAARAIINFLMTGDPSWERVISEPA